MTKRLGSGDALPRAASKIFNIERSQAMTLHQKPSQTDPDCNTVYCSVEVSRSSWVIGVYCPATDTAIGTHKLEAADTSALLALVRKR